MSHRSCNKGLWYGPLLRRDLKMALSPCPSILLKAHHNPGGLFLGAFLNSQQPNPQGVNLVRLDLILCQGERAKVGRIHPFLGVSGLTIRFLKLS